MEYNKCAALKKYGDIARAMGVDIKGMSEEQAADAAIAAVKKLAEDVNIPKTIKELKNRATGEVLLKESDLVQLSKDAFIDPCTGGNPRKTSVEEILEIYKTAY